jgi:hypothetical protein
MLETIFIFFIECAVYVLIDYFFKILLIIVGLTLLVSGIRGGSEESAFGGFVLMSMGLGSFFIRKPE